MRVVSAAEIDGALTWPALIEALAAAFRGALEAPPRHHHTIPRPDGAGTLLLMPAWSAGLPGSGNGLSGQGDGGAPPASREVLPAPREVLGVKVVTVFPGNGARGMPSVQGTYLLSDGATGAPIAALDGSRLTLWRTAAASALAARHLARPEASRMVMVGAGALAPFLIGAHRSVRAIDDVAIWARRPEAASALARRIAAEGVPARAVSDLESAVRQADLVSCATLSPKPLVQGDWLKPGQHLDLVGAFNLSMREADDRALQRARVFVDTSACLHEGGDVAVAIRLGAFDERSVRGDLAALLSGRSPGRTTPDDITLFKSIGASIEDLAAAALVWRSLPR